MPFGSVTKANKFSGVGQEAKFLQLVSPGSLKFSVENTNFSLLHAGTNFLRNTCGQDGFLIISACVKNLGQCL